MDFARRTCSEQGKDCLIGGKAYDHRYLSDCPRMQMVPNTNNETATKSTVKL